MCLDQTEVMVKWLDMDNNLNPDQEQEEVICHEQLPLLLHAEHPHALQCKVIHASKHDLFHQTHMVVVSMEVSMAEASGLEHNRFLHRRDLQINISDITHQEILVDLLPQIHTYNKSDQVVVM